MEHTTRCPFKFAPASTCPCQPDLRSDSERVVAGLEAVRTKLELINYLQAFPIEVVLRAVADLVGMHIETLRFPWDNWFELREELESLASDPHQHAKEVE